MIVSELIGGLGNQLFQYAAGLQLSRKFGMEHYVGLNAIEQYSTWSYKLNSLVTPKVIYNYSNCAVYIEKSFEYSRIILPTLSRCVLKGYFQSHLYSNEVIDEIRELSVNRLDSYPEIFNLIKLLSNSESLFFHIRRGDYLNPKSNSFHGIINTKAIISAIEYLVKLKKVEFILGFSDDVDLLSDVIKNINSTQVKIINVSEFGFRDVEELLIMSQCGNAIIANSSFSWWGAYLSHKCTNGIVMYPEKWFADSSINTKDLHPTSWIGYK